MEGIVAFFCEATAGTMHPLNRHQSVTVVALIQVVTNTLCVLSMTGNADCLTVMGYNLFDSANILATNLLIPIGALGLALYTGWFVPKARYQGSRVASFIYLVILRWLVPVAIVTIFLNSVNII
jgi:NSS family neurotransmitter:Na+ symporter